MSKQIDQNVVALEFDNRNFEKNVKQSMNTLDQLEKKCDMKGSTKGLDALGKAANKVSFDNMSRSIDTVRIKLSAMQVVGMTVLSNITNQAFNFAKKVESTVKDAVIGGGIRRAQNIENAHFMLQGLLKDEKKVQEVMANAMDSVDGTAYAYDEAAKAASQFAASGIEAGDQMMRALRGITGVAAMTNSSYEDISRVFTTVAGNGRLMGDQLLQLSSRGMNAAATLAKHFGKTEEEIRDMVSHGEISFEMFAEAMDSAFGEHAKKANETFNGALANIKAALSRFGAKFVSPLVVQNGVIVKLFNTIRERVNDFSEAIGPLSNVFVSLVERVTKKLNTTLNNKKAFRNTLDGIENIIMAMGNFAKIVHSAFREIFPAKSQADITKATKAFADLTERLLLTDKSAEKLKNTFKGVFAILDIIAYLGKSVISTIAYIFKDITVETTNTDVAVTDMIMSFRDWIKEGDKVGSVMRNIVDVVKSAVNALTKFNKTVKGGGGGGMQSNMTAFQKFASVVATVFNGVKNYIFGGIEAIKAFAERTKDLEGMTVGDVFKDFAENVIGYFFDIGAAFDWLMGVISKFSSNTKSEFDKTQNVFTSFGKGILSKLKEFKDKYFKEADFSSLYAVGFSIATIAVLKKIYDGLKKIGSFAETLLGPLTGINKVLESFAGVLTMYQKKLKADVILELAAAIAILAGSVAVLALVPTDRLGPAVGAIIALVAGLAVVTGILSASSFVTTVGTIAEVGVAMVSFAGAMFILAAALDSLGSIKDIGKTWEDFSTIAGLMIGVISLLTVVVGLVGHFSKSVMGLNLVGLGAAMVGFGAGLKLVIMALSDFEKLDPSKVSPEKTDMLAKTLLGFAAIVFASRKVGLKSAVGVLALAASLNIIVKALNNIGKLDVSNTESTIKRLGIIFGSMLVMATIGKLAGKNMMQAGIGILAMSAGLWLLLESFKKIDKFKPTEINKSIKALAGIFAAFTIVIVASNKAGKEAHKAGLMLLEISAAMILISGSIAILGNMDAKKVKQGVQAIAALELVFGALIALTKFGNGDKGLYGTIVTLTVAVVAITGCLAVLTGLDQDKLQSATGSLALIMGMFGVIEGIAMYSSSVVKFSSSFKRLAGTIALITAAIGVLKLCIAGLAQMPADQVQAAGNAIAEVGIIFGALTLLCSYIGKSGPGAIKAAAAGAGAFDIVIGLIGGFVMAVGGMAVAIEDFAGYDVVESLEKGAEMFGKIGEAIGSLIGGIGAGIINEMTGTLPTFGQNLADFMTTAKPFFDGLSAITPDTASAARDLALTIGVLTASDMLTNLQHFATLGLDKKLFGESSFNADTLKGFGEAIKAFADATTDIDEGTAKQISATANAALAITNLAESIPNTGGVIAFFTGDNDMGAFATGMKSFGKALKGYADSVTDLNTEAIETSVTAANSILDVADAIPNSGGAIAYLTGDNKMDQFGLQMVTFGNALVAYSNSVANLKFGAVDLSKTAAEKILEIADAIPNSGGAIGWLVGNNDMDAFGTKLESFGSAMSAYGDSVASTNFGAILKSTEPIKTLLEAFSKIPKKKSFKNLDDFGKEMTNFATSLKTFSKRTTKIDSIQVSSMAKAVGDIVKVFNKLGNIDADAASNFNSALKKISTNTIKNFANSFSESSKDLSKCGTDMIDNVIKGINSNKDGIKVNLMNNVISAIAGVRSTYSSWFSAGSYLVQGLCNGILSQTANAIAAARKIGSVANDALKDELREESPSKESYEYGEFYVTGFVNALGAGEKKVGKVAASLGKVTNKMFKKSIKSIMSTDTLTNLRKWLGDAAGALDQFVNRYVNGASNISAANGAMHSAAQAIRDYMNVLYERSSYYATDTQNLKDHKSQLKDLEKQHKSLQKKIKSATKENTKKSKERVKTLKTELETNEDAIEQAKNQIEQDRQDIINHTKQAYNDLKNSLKQSVESFINPLAVSIESGINLFSKFENKETQLAEAQKNLADYTNEYETALQKQKDLQNEIERMEKINTTASRQHGKELEKELEAVTKTVDKLKDKVQDYQDQVTELSTFTTRSVLDDMKSQAENVEKYWANINKLYSEGKFSTGLLDQLKAMGIEGSDYVNKFVEMTQTEIDEANSYFERASKTSATALLRNFEDAMNQATSWSDGIAKLEAKGFNRAILEGLGDLGINGADYLEAFLSMDESQIASFNEKYARYLKLPDEVADSVISSYAIAGNQTVDAYIGALNGVAEKLQELNNKIATTVLTLLGLKSGSVGLEVGTKLSDSVGSDKNKKKAKKAGKTLGKSAMKGFTDKNEGVNSKTAESSVDDFTKGLDKGVKNNTSKTQKLFDEWSKNYCLGAFKNGLDEHSPSKEAIKAIKYFADGIVIGFDNSVGEVSTAAENVANVILDSVSNVLDADLDTQPTITPVIDLSEIQNGANSINQTLGNMSGTISLDNSKANSIQSIRNDTNAVWGAINELKDTVKQLGNVQGETVINNQFNIENPDPNAVANEVSVILQRQIDRRSKEWA